MGLLIKQVLILFLMLNLLGVVTADSSKERNVKIGNGILKLGGK